MEKYLFIVPVAVEHASVLVVDQPVDQLVWVGVGQGQLSTLMIRVLKVVSVSIQSRLQFSEQT